jgi:glycine hydroxymethyltransferase
MTERPHRISLTLAQADPDVAAALDHETLRQHEGLEMIASENFVSEAVLEAAGSIFTNKYAEGYPGRRYYGGCEYADVVENLARDRAKQLFGGEHINVQPHSGSQANASAYAAVLQAGDTILGLDLSHGGHLTHGHRLSFSGKLYRPTFYQVRKDTELIDYDELEAIALREKPKVLIGGGSAYPRLWDFERMRQIADKVGAVYVFDMAHIAGLVAGGVHPSPVPHAHITTTTTHKTLRGPRAGMIICGQNLADSRRQGRLPRPARRSADAHRCGQGRCLRRSAAPEFKTYAAQTVANAKTLASPCRKPASASSPEERTIT